MGKYLFPELGKDVESIINKFWRHEVLKSLSKIVFCVYYSDNHDNITKLLHFNELKYKYTIQWKTENNETKIGLIYIFKKNENLINKRNNFGQMIASLYDKVFHLKNAFHYIYSHTYYIKNKSIFSFVTNHIASYSYKMTSSHIDKELDTKIKNNIEKSFVFF